LTVVYFLRGFATGLAAMLVLFGSLAMWTAVSDLHLTADGWLWVGGWYWLPVLAVLAGIIAVLLFLHGGRLGLPWLTLGLAAVAVWTTLVIFESDVWGFPVLARMLEGPRWS
jgi:hypothetical protein